ncbi:MAG: cation-translocating P-type ATPase [Verrucomicrobiaceae bacterium]|nr:cation-translocating P-type ATPase [Verrucomicrobiaceae bacterium]
MKLPPTATPAIWHTLPEDDICQRLATTRTGLCAAEAARRLAEHGPNEIQETKPISRFAIFVRQFTSLIVWLLIIAAVVAGALGEMVDAIAILAIVVLNGVIGFYQEYKAEQSIAALRKMTAPQARVRRDGRAFIVPATQLVPGDVLEIEAGDLVAADARLVNATSLRCIEAALTGESEAVDKLATVLGDAELPLGDLANMLFKGTSVAAGQGEAIVVATGMSTELGRIAGLIEQAGAGERTPLQEKLEAFGRVLVWASLGIVALLFVLGLLRGMGLLEMFMTSVSLAVAAVPEGMPAVVTIALALGVMRMSRRRALVRKLPAVETLGSTNVICTDKTGTLTVGDMTVRELFVDGQTYAVTGEGYGPHGEILIEGRATGAEHAEELLELATTLLAANNAQLVLEDGAWKVIGDPTEGAMRVAGHKAGGVSDDVERELPKHHEIPFDSDRKRRTVVRIMPQGHLRAFVNGAPDVLLRRCTKLYTDKGIVPLDDARRTQIKLQNEAMAARALRVLGAAYRDLPHGTVAHDITDDHEQDLVFVGLAGMYDPPRPEAKKAVARCHDAGIRVVMITGDHPHTALAIARELGIAAPDDTVVSGAELNKMSDDDLRTRAPHIGVYARVTAEHKLRIVHAWKANNAVVAMTGDGVNDAPALKGADIGIAMGIKGTEVTKQASDMIVTDDNFASIVAAVEQGRGIYDNIRKTLQYLLASNSAELLLMTLCIVIGLPAPLLPIHLLWINLVTDGLPALCLATDAIDPDVMRRRPRARTEGMMDRAFLVRMVIGDIATVTVCFGIFIWARHTSGLDVARSMTFTALAFCELCKSFSFRSETKPLWKLCFRSNLQLPLVVAASFALQLMLHHVPVLSRLLGTVVPEWHERWLLLGAGLIPFAALELFKVFRHKPAPMSASIAA